MSSDDDTDGFPSILTLHGSYASSCGYCGPPGQRSASPTSVTLGATPNQLSCSIYQQMIDRNWRRSGRYIYQPTNIQTCCPQYAIRLDALAFEPSRNSRKALYRFNRFILSGKDGEEVEGEKLPNIPTVNGDSKKPTSDMNGKAKLKPRKQVFSLVDAVHEPEASFLPEGSKSKYKFEVTIEPASYTEEKFELYKDYQFHVHHESEKVPSSFKGFLVDSDLMSTPIPYTSTPLAYLPTHYGTHHQLYKIDGELVAMGVLDILPGCVSSVYFMYKNKWERCQFGKLSVLREAALAREMHAAGLPRLKWVYLGFYVHSCPKMQYKGDYSPSFLLDPENYEWYPLKDYIPLLDKDRYAVFSNPSHSSTPSLKPTIPDIPQKNLKDVMMVFPRGDRFSSQPIADMNSMAWNAYKTDILETIYALGRPLAQKIYFFFH